MGATILANKYRPVTFADVVGQSHIKPILQAIVASGEVPPALIFSGTRGVGKTTCARIFAAALNCQNPDNGDSCGTCAQCMAVRNFNSSSVLEIDAASSGGVNEVRKIKDLCHYGHEGEWRVILLDEAHSMSKEAYNALLKILEEPPTKTVFVLVTTEPEKIIGTVRSRSMPFEFRRVKLSDLASRLRHIAETEGIEGDDELFSEISKSAQGGLRDAVMLLDQITRVGVSTASGFRDFFGIQDYSVPLMWSALRGDYAEGHRLVTEHFSRTGEAAGLVSDLSRLVTDLLSLKCGGTPQGYAEEALAERVEMAGAVTSEALVRVIEILWELRSRTRATENDQRSAMEMAFALVANSVRAVTDPTPPEEPTETQQSILLDEDTGGSRLSLDEISEIAASYR